MAPKPYQTEIRVSFVHFADDQFEAEMLATLVKGLVDKLILSLNNVALARASHTTTEHPDV